MGELVGDGEAIVPVVESVLLTVAEGEDDVPLDPVLPFRPVSSVQAPVKTARLNNPAATIFNFFISCFLF